LVSKFINSVIATTLGCFDSINHSMHSFSS
jgi:hypothetical protein